LVGGGYMNTLTGQTWSDPSVGAVQASEYEKNMVEMLKGLFGGI
jgi:hypothetical protein